MAAIRFVRRYISVGDPDDNIGKAVMVLQQETLNDSWEDVPCIDEETGEPVSFLVSSS
jgi:hypothetical protein